ncbi:hypothetical protein CRYUN_Cryun11dG0150900 [Craigia yunnanensis]
MEGINSRDVNQETYHAPLVMSPSNTENQVARGQGQGVGKNMDPKKLKRVAASREYSQRYRLKQLQYIAELETGVRALQAQVAISFPRIKYADTQNSLLREENGSMKQKLSVLSRELMLKEAEYHELKKERDALKQMSLLYQAPYIEIQTNNYQTNNYQTNNSYQTNYQTNNNYQQLNIALDQPGFNQFMEAAGEPNMSNQNLGNRFGSDVNNGDNSNPM